MTWSKFDDAAPKSPKAVAAGNDAWALWAAAVMYCNRHNTDGYVTLAALATDCLPKPIPVAKARKLAVALCDAKARPDGKGLFESDRNDMFRVHDFLDWNPSKVEVESKRKKDRDRKRGPLESERNPEGVRETERADSETPRAPARAIPSRPVPSQPDQPPPDLKLAVDTDRETICPLDLTDRAEAAGIYAEIAKHLKVSEAALREEARLFVSYWTIGGGMGKKRRNWMAMLRQRFVDRAGEGKLPKIEPEAHTWPG